MSKWVHRITESNLETKTGLCSSCGPVKVKLRAGGTRVSCSFRELKYESQRSRLYYRIYRKFLRAYCERCGFVPEDTCQLDIDHVDGNHDNNDPKNLQTLCANCHRLKTKKERAAG